MKRTEKCPDVRGGLIVFIRIVYIFQAHRHIRGKCPGDGNGLANEEGFVQVRTLRDGEWTCVIDADAHDFAERGGCEEQLQVAFRPSTTYESL